MPLRKAVLTANHERCQKPQPIDIPRLIEKLQHNQLKQVKNNCNRYPPSVDISWKDGPEPYSTIGMYTEVARNIHGLLKLPTPSSSVVQIQDPQLSSPIKRWPNVDIEDMKEWSDFTGENLRQSLPHVYSLSFDTDSFRVWDLLNAHLQWQKRYFHDEDSIRVLAHYWQSAILQTAFKVASQQFVEDLNLDLDNSGRHEPSLRLLAEGCPVRNFRVTNGRTGVKTRGGDLLVAGELKVAQEWRFEDALSVSSRDGGRAKGLWPIMEVGSYCLISGTKYGMIMSEEEVVVMEFWGSTCDTDGRNDLQLRYRRAPWYDDGSSHITALEAIFGITILSLYDRDRVIGWQENPGKIQEIFSNLISKHKVILSPEEEESRKRAREVSVSSSEGEPMSLDLFLDGTHHCLETAVLENESETIAARVKARAKRAKRA